MTNPEKFIFLEDEATADVAFLAFGGNVDELFENACLALTTVMADTSNIEQIQIFEDTIRSEDFEGLLYDVLELLLFTFETQDLLFSKFQVEIDSIKFEAKLKAWGEHYNPKKHDIKTHIKAITFFGMEVNKNSLKVTLDL